MEIEGALTAVPDEAVMGLLRRVLLTTDATVVRLLEGVFAEPIRTAGLGQERGAGTPGDAPLELDPGAPVLHRRTALEGARSGRRYAYATASIALDRLDPRVRVGLLGTPTPIGALLTAHRIETFREVLRAGRRAAGPLGRRLGLEPAEELPFRTYRILAGGRPVMLITEYFPPLARVELAGS